MTEDIYTLRQAQPMLLVDGQPFDSSEYIFELKLDGIRCLAYLDEQTELRNKRNKNVTVIYPELSDIHKQVGRKCILDGEIIVAINGVPDFFEIQRRSLMTDAFKIELLSKSKPVSFVVYDIIYLDNQEVIEKPLMQRKEMLTEIVRENNRIAISRYIEEKGIEFYQLAAKQNLEGIVAKKKKSLYYYGKRSKDWVKFKKMIEEDFVICGYIKDDDGGSIKSVILGAYKDKQLIYQGHVALGISKEDAKIIINYARNHSTFQPFSEKMDEEGAIWMKPDLVCAVKYMMRTHTFGLRQPVYKGLRDDKDPTECQLGV